MVSLLFELKSKELISSRSRPRFQQHRRDNSFPEARPSDKFRKRVIKGTQLIHMGAKNIRVIVVHHAAATWATVGC